MKNKFIFVPFIVAFVQFINALEYMIIAPIGPYLLKVFNLHLNQIGILTGTYTCFAVLSGILGFFCLDRFNKKKALITTLIILALTNLLTIFCTTIHTVLIIRSIAGCFGGITGSLSMSLLISMIKEKDRNKAYSIVMCAFPLVSILGTPGGIWLTEYFGYKILFITISGLILVGGLMTIFLIPDCPHTFDKNIHKRIKLDKHSLLAMSLLGIAGFPIYLLIPSLAIIMKYNMHISNHQLPLIFMIGGISSLLGAQLSGKLINKIGSKLLIHFSTIIFIAAIIFSLILPILSPFIFMSILMASVYIRLISSSILTSNYPESHQRSGFSALQSAINNIGATGAGLLSTFILVVEPNMKLGNTTYLALIIIISAILLQIGVFYHYKHLQQP